MPEFKGQNQARLVAPIALALFAVIFFAVILSSGGSDKGERTSTAQRASGKGGGKKGGKRKARGATYTVKAGDTLGSIAEKTGLTVEQLQERNPDLDAQALVSGQKIKLRE